MVRTKKHFKPPSDDDDSSSSSSEDDDQQQPIMGRGKQLVGRGKQLVPSGRGKQLRAPEPAEDDSSDDSSSSDDDEPPPSPSRGKQLNRPTGRGKQLRAPSPQHQDSSDSSDDEIVQPRGGGKQFGMNRGMGKQLPRPTEPMEEDSDDSSSDDEPWNAPRGQGKQLRPPAAAAAAAKEESDMDESSEEEEEEIVVKKKPAPKKKAAPKAKATKKKKAPPKKKAKQPVIESDSEDYADTDEDESDFEPEPSKKKKAAAPKRKGRPPARAAATRATRSAKAAAVESEEDDDSSDESSDEEQEWDMETFDTQKLVQSAEDKKMLDALPEIERESILAERFEKLKAEADMKKAVKEQKRREREQKKATGAQKKKSTRKRAATTKAKKAAPAKKKRVTKKKAESEEESDEDMDDTLGDEALAASMAGKRTSTRNLAKKGKQFKKQAALAKIKSARANKQAAMEESESDLDYGKDSDDSDDDYEEATPWQKKQQKATKKPVPESSDDDASMGVDDDDERQGRKRTEDVEADLKDYKLVSLPRRSLGSWCHEPWFEKAVKNFYVRLSVGRDNKTQKACYRFCKIEGVVTKNEYTFTYTDTDTNEEQSVTTDKWLQVSFGSSKRDFKMIVVSESRLDEDDLNKYISQMKTERLGDELLTKKQAKKMAKHSEDLRENYTYTKDDIDMLVKEKRKRSKKSLNLGMEKTRIGIAVQAAKEEVQEAKNRLQTAEEEITEAGTEEEALEDNLKKAKEALDAAEKKLEETLEEQKKLQKEDQDRENRLRNNTKVQNWARVNQRAKLANRNADFQAYKEEQARLKKEGSAEPKFDPYARRRQKPKNLWEVGGKSQASDDKDKASDVVTEEEKSKEAMERDDADVGKEGGNGENKREEVPEPKKMQMPAQANKFAFDDDIVIGDLASLGVGKKKVRTRARKGISLEDYQERKTAGTL